jgi:DNA-directed RNA polymerase-3 subunit RPC5
VGSKVAENHDEEMKEKPKLLSCLNNAEYLNEISAPMDAAKLSRSQKVKKSKGKGKEKAVEGEGDGAETDTLDAISDPSMSDTEDEDEPPTSKV